MRAPQSLRDATNTVALDDARAVADATERVLQKCYGAGRFDRDLLHAAFGVVDRLFAGEYPGYLACDMPYHDMRHSLDTALIMARLVDGSQRTRNGATDALTPEHGLLGVLLALLHDVGYLRQRSEAALCGPQLMPVHESRGIAFAENYLRTTSLADCAALAALIDATRLASDPRRVFAGLEESAIALGHMLGTADLLSQVADSWYLERCYFHLYPELVLGRCDRTRAPDGHEQLLYRDAFDLVSKTRIFYERVVRKRLDDDFAHVARFLAVHFAGADPHADTMQANLDRLDDVVATGGVDLLRGEPLTTTRDLAPIYHTRPPRPLPRH